MKSNSLWTLNSTWSFLVGVAVGAGLMYMLDPDRGRRRRALVRDQAVHASHVVSDTASGTAKDLSNRAYGVAAETRSAVSSDNLAETARQAVQTVTGHADSR